MCLLLQYIVVAWCTAAAAVFAVTGYYTWYLTYHMTHANFLAAFWSHTV